MKNINCAQKTRIVVALLSAIFILSMVSPALANAYTPPSSTPTVTWFHEDTTTGGDWYHNPQGSPITNCACKHVYGSYAYILPDPPITGLEYPISKFTTPIGDLTNPTLLDLTTSPLFGIPYDWTWNQVAGIPGYKATPPYWDQYHSTSPKVTYLVNGTKMILLPPVNGLSFVQYPVFEYSWGDPQLSKGSDARIVYYPNPSGITNPPYPATIPSGTSFWRLASWDDGGERSQPQNGYMNFTLFFPQGNYVLSLYAYDYEHLYRSTELFRIYDKTGTHLLASKQIGGTTFDQGVYESFLIKAGWGGSTIILQVYNDAGHAPISAFLANPTDPATINVVLSGIFVDKAAYVCGNQCGCGS